MMVPPWDASADLLAGQVHVVAFNDASPAIAEADEFVAVLLDTVEHGAADDSVQGQSPPEVSRPIFILAPC